MLRRAGSCVGFGALVTQPALPAVRRARDFRSISGRWPQHNRNAANKALRGPVGGPEDSATGNRTANCAVSRAAGSEAALQMRSRADRSEGTPPPDRHISFDIRGGFSIMNAAGPVAQLGERLPRTEEVGGSIPLRSTSTSSLISSHSGILATLVRCLASWAFCGANRKTGLGSRTPLTASRGRRDNAGGRALRGVGAPR
jgi:hypothetical protein